MSLERRYTAIPMRPQLASRAQTGNVVARTAIGPKYVSQMTPSSTVGLRN